VVGVKRKSNGWGQVDKMMKGSQHATTKIGLGMGSCCQNPECVVLPFKKLYEWLP